MKNTNKDRKKEEEKAAQEIFSKSRVFAG